MSDKPIEELIPSWFKGTLNSEEREKVVQWKDTSEENREVFAASKRAWEGLEQLRLMKKYDSEKALLQVHPRIQKLKINGFWSSFQKVAAVLFLPLLTITLLALLNNYWGKTDSTVAWHTLEVPAGMRSVFYLPDSTKVYLNSKTSLSYPLSFSEDIREVKLTGEAYFEVTENNDVPFIINTGRINIEVTGTEFIATTYPQENLTEIILIEGGINLFQGDFLTSKNNIVKLNPGERALLKADDKEMTIDHVNTGKYIAWKKGLLVFRDDPMPEVIKRLNRWFNVDIQLEGPKLRDWAYTATFEDESLEQVLELLKISAPVDYSIKPRELKNDKTFSKMEIIIRQKRKQ